MQNTKIIEIKDMEDTKYFQIRLFDVETGLDFVDKLAILMRDKAFSIKPFLSDLLPLASLMDSKGHTVVKEGLTLQDCYGLFQSPVAVLELGMSILEYQKVFMTNSKVFQPLIQNLEHIWSSKSSELETN